MNDKIKLLTKELNRYKTENNNLKKRVSELVDFVNVYQTENSKDKATIQELRNYKEEVKKDFKKTKIYKGLKSELKALNKKLIQQKRIINKSQKTCEY